MDRIAWRQLLVDFAFGRTFGRVFLLMAVAYLTVGVFALVFAWELGPQRVIDARRASPFVTGAEARIAESWVALEFDPQEMGSSKHWPGFARVTPCSVLEWEGDWGSARRAFCGARRHLHEGFTVHDLRELLPGVAFDFARDANGFRVPEIRVGKPGFEYLAREPAMNPFRKFSALEEFRRRLDRPVDGAIESWTRERPKIRLAFDPANPAEARPEGFIAARRGAEVEWIPTVMLTFFGLAFWFAGMNLILLRVPLIPRIVLAAAPLVGLPWFAQEFPNALRHFDLDVATTIADELANIEPASRIVASEPSEALLRGGERITFAVDKGLYADTVGTLHFAPPEKPVPSADEALAALVSATTEQVRRMNGADRADLFERLLRDKKNGLIQAGLVFVPVAKETMLDARGDLTARKAARDFLAEWVMQPVLDPDPQAPAFAEKLRIYRLLLDVPENVIWYPASWIVERAEKAQAAGPKKTRR